MSFEWATRFYVSIPVKESHVDGRRRPIEPCIAAVARVISDSEPLIQTRSLVYTCMQKLVGSRKGFVIF